MRTPDLSEFNFTIKVDDVATAIKKVNAYSTEQRIRRFDDVAASLGRVNFRWSKHKTTTQRSTTKPLFSSLPARLQHDQLMN